MAERFVPLTPRIAAKAVMRREEVLDPAFADECRAALERYGVLLFPQIGLDDEEQVAFSRNLGDVVPLPVGNASVPVRLVAKVRAFPTADAQPAVIVDLAWLEDALSRQSQPAPR